MRLRHFLPLFLALGVAAPVLAQQPTDSTPKPTAPLFTRGDAWLATAFLAGAAAMLPLDERVAVRLQQPDAQASMFVENAAIAAEFMASPGAFVLGGSLYVIGHAARSPGLADLGWHGAEAALLSAASFALLKGSAGRARPLASDGDSRHFEPGRGFGGGSHGSFPSGDAATAFATAAVVTSEAARWSPRSRWIVAPLAYGGATTVALAQMYHAEHWATDAVVGAALGTFTGLKVVRYHHTRPGNRLDRWVLGPLAVAPVGGGGALVVWSVPLSR